LIKNEALTQFSDKAIKESNQIMIKKLFAEFQSVWLFIAATKAELKQTVIRSERERFTQPILYWFTQPLTTSSSQNNHWVPVVTTHRLQQHNHKEVTLKTTRLTHPLCNHTPHVKTPYDLQDFTHIYKFIKVQSQE